MVLYHWLMLAPGFSETLFEWFCDVKGCCILCLKRELSECDQGSVFLACGTCVEILPYKWKLEGWREIWSFLLLALLLWGVGERPETIATHSSCDLAMAPDWELGERSILIFLAAQVGVFVTQKWGEIVKTKSRLRSDSSHVHCSCWDLLDFLECVLFYCLNTLRKISKN